MRNSAPAPGVSRIAASTAEGYTLAPADHQHVVDPAEDAAGEPGVGAPAPARGVVQQALVAGPEPDHRLRLPPEVGGHDGARAPDRDRQVGVVPVDDLGVVLVLEQVHPAVGLLQAADVGQERVHLRRRAGRPVDDGEVAPLLPQPGPDRGDAAAGLAADQGQLDPGVGAPGCRAPPPGAPGGSGRTAWR